MTRAVPRLPLALLPAVALAQGTGPAKPLFRDIRAEAGIAFQHHSAPEKKFIVESMSGGVAALDYDNDGRIDLYFVDSLTVDTAKDPKAARSALYRNLGGNRFEDVTDKAGVAHPGWGMGLCTADVDGDGFEDVYVTNLGPNRLYRNNRDGSFTDIAAEAGVTAGAWSTGCAFGDYDRDSDLDLFVSRYVKIDLANLPEFGKGKSCEYRGLPVQCGPRGLPGEGDLLFRNDGDGKFTDVSVATGVHDPRGHFGLGVAWLDADQDGWLDLYVANDSNANFLYINQKDGTFKETAFAAGVAVSEDGAEQGSMGLAIGDYDNSGRFSIFTTNFSEEYNALYHNGGAYFSDWSFRSMTAASSLPYVGWGTVFFDYDNDGFQDMIVCNGHVYPQLDQAQLRPSAPYRQRRLLYHNRGDGTFEEVAALHGEALMEPRVGRGLAMTDLDDDGRVDLVLNDLDGFPQVLRNVLEPVGHWLWVKLKGEGKNTSAVGAVVRVRVGSLTMQRLVRSGSSYLSQDDKRQHFGLGAATRADWVEVLWPDQTTTRLENVVANQVLEIRKP